MKNLLLMVLALFAFALLASGCYTQLNSTRDEEPRYSSNEENENRDEQYENDEYSEEYNEDYDYRRDRLYWDYYYPSATVLYSVPVHSPWHWRNRLSLSWVWWNDPWYYSSYYPWGWCGTSYPAIYAGWWSPIYYDPWYGWNSFGYGWHGYGWTGGYGYGGSRDHGSTRTIGVTRTGGDTRDNTAAKRTGARALTMFCGTVSRPM